MTGDLFSMLDTFRQTHTTREITWQGTQYPYLIGGKGKPGLFLLPGGLGIGEPFFPYFLELEEQFTVIAPSYPAVSDLDEMAAGLDQMAREEGAIPYSLVGQSAGGLFAQILVRRYPQHVNSVVLSHTTTVTKDFSQEVIAARIAGMKKRLRLLQLIPYCFVKRSLMNSISKIVETLRPDELAFWTVYFEYIFGLRTKQNQIAMLKLLINFASHYRFSPNDLEKWPGKIMIIDSDSDASIPENERQAVRALYPSATLHTLEGVGHLAILSERETYLKLIRAFLIA
ncbi:MAG: alpha/beta hydrolase [Anaerolineales bacterium]|nr:alpha/beta hydrolase [Anaerolineales bacterium]